MVESQFGEIGAVGSGFAGAGQALHSAKQGNDQLQQQIESGQLTIDPDAAEKAAKVYEDKADRVDDLGRSANRLNRVEGLGEYRSGQELAKKFEMKAKNGSTGASDLLTALRDELYRKADLFREAAKDYVATDEQIGQDAQRSLQ